MSRKCLKNETDAWNEGGLCIRFLFAKVEICGQQKFTKYGGGFFSWERPKTYCESGNRSPGPFQFEVERRLTEDLSQL